MKVYYVAELERLTTDYLARRLGQTSLSPSTWTCWLRKSKASRWLSGPSSRPTIRFWGWSFGTWARVSALYVFVNEDLADNDTPNGLARYRMTVAEELAHVRLHRPLIDAIQSPDDFRKLHGHPQWKEIERDAKKFAAMLLMPTRSLMANAREVYGQIVGQPQICEQFSICRVSNRWEPQIKKRLCIAMAKRFQVSRWR